MLLIFSGNLKCPLTAPAKPRMSRMAFISSLSHKVTENNVKVVKPLSKVSATPNAKVKQSPSLTKALTTPRNPKKVSNLEQFRSVQNKKAVTVAVPKAKSRVVAKALVFNSPKKMIDTKSSVELKTSMKALCSAMKKLEFNGVKKNGEGCNNSLPVDSSRKKQFKGREVKSRVFDSLYSSNRKGPETSNVRCPKEKKVKAMQKHQVPEQQHSDTSDMEIEEKSRSDSLEREESSRDDTTSLSSSIEDEKKTIEESENEEKRMTVSDKGKTPEAKKRKADKKSMASDDKENEIELTEDDDKENSSAPSENM